MGIGGSPNSSNTRVTRDGNFEVTAEARSASGDKTQRPLEDVNEDPPTPMPLTAPCSSEHSEGYAPQDDEESRHFHSLSDIYAETDESGTYEDLLLLESEEPTSFREASNEFV